MDYDDKECQSYRLGANNSLTCPGDSPEESKFPINILELKAIRISLQHATSLLQGQPDTVHSGNVTAVAYIKHHGGTRNQADLKNKSALSLVDACIPADNLPVSLEWTKKNRYWHPSLQILQEAEPICGELLDSIQTGFGLPYNEDPSSAAM